jgi:uncharacterized repeat protein (TIGR03809 family)
MTHRQEVARGRDIVARWCNLAEQRLEHLTELFETGRWRRYHSERAFLENIQEAKAAVETWRDLLTREASRENFALDISWLGRARATLPRDAQPRRIRPFSLQPASFPDELPRAVAPTGLEAIQASLRDAPRVSSKEAPSVPTFDAPAFEPELRPVAATISESALQPMLDSASALTLDIISAVQQRYPLLRNSL